MRGEVLTSGPGWVVVGLGPGAGVGLRVEVPARFTGGHVGAQVALHTHLVVREDALTLFGFDTADELEVFGVLIGVSGVGPRSALGVLSELTPAEIAHAVVNEDEKPFRRVSGIGPKTAKLISVQLAGKLEPRRFGKVQAEGGVVTVSDESRAAATVAVGLAGLGYLESQAAEAVQAALAAGAPHDEAGLLRAALALLQTPRLPGATR